MYYHTQMALQLIKENRLISAESDDELDLQLFCEEKKLSVTFVWINGQYYLHSDQEKERPITIEIDQELHRHEEFFKRSSLQKELLAKAIGVKGPFRPKVLDLTGGLLGDTLLFLSFGCEVTCIERNPIIAFLIKSALKNAQHPAIQRLQFIQTDALEFLETKPLVDVIYFDPMFEDANQKVLPRKEMRIFRMLIGEDQDSLQVFNKALSLGVKRLVVKRPRHSSALGFRAPLEFSGKSTRYDVYLGQNHGPFASNPLK